MLCVGSCDVGRFSAGLCVGNDGITCFLKGTVVNQSMTDTDAIHTQVTKRCLPQSGFRMPLRFGIYVYGVSLGETKISREGPGGLWHTNFFLLQ